jgi:uncharacterized protein (TIGR03067 family)
VASDQENLQGVWRFLLIKAEGGKPPSEEALKKLKLTINGNKMSHPRENGKDAEATFTLDSSKKPKTLDMTIANGPEKGEKLLAIYALEGDSLRICAAIPGGERPTEFRAGKEVELIELTREKP